MHQAKCRKLKNRSDLYIILSVMGTLLSSFFVFFKGEVIGIFQDKEGQKINSLKCSKIKKTCIFTTSTSSWSRAGALLSAVPNPEAADRRWSHAIYWAHNLQPVTGFIDCGGITVETFWVAVHHKHSATEQDGELLVEVVVSIPFFC